MVWCFTKSRVDPCFGVLKYRTLLFKRHGFWKGEVHFGGSGKPIDVYILGKKTGIDDSQRKFYLDLTRRYSELEAAIHHCLLTTLDVYWGDLFHKYRPQPEWSDFSLEHLLIPTHENSNDEWELSYLFEPFNESYTIYFIEWKPIRGEFDD